MVKRIDVVVKREGNHNIYFVVSQHEKNVKKCVKKC